MLLFALYTLEFSFAYFVDKCLICLKRGFTEYLNCLVARRLGVIKKQYFLNWQIILKYDKQLIN